MVGAGGFGGQPLSPLSNGYLESLFYSRKAGARRRGSAPYRVKGVLSGLEFFGLVDSSLINLDFPRYGMNLSPDNAQNVM